MTPGKRRLPAVRASGEHAAPSRETLRDARDWVRARLSRERYRHTEGVVRCARVLARRNGLNPLKAELAAWLHDSCKEASRGEISRLLRGTPFRLDAWERKIPALWHAAVAAALAWKVWGVRDRAVLEAIRRHSVGCARMGLLAQVLFAADYLEPGRSFHGAAVARRRASRGLREAILVKCEQILAYSTENGLTVHPGLLETWNSFLPRNHRS